MNKKFLWLADNIAFKSEWIAHIVCNVSVMKTFL